MTPQEQIKKLLKTIDASLSTFTEGLSPIQQNTYRKLIELSKGLDIYAGGNLKNNLTNIKLVGKLRSELEGIVLSDKYLSHVSVFATSYKTIAKLQNQYFSTIASEFKDKGLFEQIMKNAITDTVENLTESGVATGYVDAIKDILQTNISAGGSYADLTNQLSNFVVGGENVEGGLVKYARQTATDSINQFNATYNRAVSDDLGLTFYQYLGSLITTSRPFCKAMVDKRYFHVSEIPELLKGHIGEKNVAINDKTGLPQGMIEGTNQQTFFINRGGYFCQHQIFAVPISDVPPDVVARFSEAIPN